MGAFDGKRIVVTGGSSGIGLAVARTLRARGAEICVVARRAEPLAEAVAELGNGSWGHSCDVGDPGQVEELALAVGSRWESVNGLVNGAGLATMADTERTDADLWDQCLAVNSRGPFLVTRALLPHLNAAGHSSVVNISSTLAEKPIPGMVAYCAAKAAVNGLTRAMALEVAPRVRVNAVMPAVVDTPIHRSRNISRDQLEGMAKLHPLRRIGRPEDVAAAIVFLLSDESAWMTGAVIPVDGGMLAT
ncbi:MAG: SDR family oxidoreductase [Acidobacteria bacterium]|nr:SDR family oxidoreductase [Acidobacteriota bacterium]